jgi:serine/threonine protein kinase
MPRLQILTGPQQGQTFELKPPGPYRIGRDPRTEFPLFDRRASRRHFRVDFRDPGYLLTDLRSLGGTYVNDQRVTTAILNPQDTIRVGKTSLRFDLRHDDDEMLGRELGGYRILERVGQGGMGTVYRSLQRSLSRVVALKILPEKVANKEELSALFLHEARAAAKLSHPNIVRVYDVNLIEGVLFYSMEYMARGSTLDLLRKESRVPIGRAVTIALQAARAIEYATRVGVVHRDVKPANLMLHQDGTVKLGDLGIATYKGDVSVAGGICGSPHYMSPEQALGREVDSRADIYSLGATLYQLLTGTPPFPLHTVKEVLKAQIGVEPAPLREVRPEVPTHLAALVEHMMAKDVEARVSTPEKLTERLEAISMWVGDHDPIETDRRQRARRRRLIFGVILVAGVLSGVLLARLLLG